MNDESVMAGPPVLEDVQSITDGFQSIVQRYPECLAIISRHQSGAYYSMDSSGGLDVGKDDQKLHLRWTYRTLDRIIRRLAKALSANDVREGTPIFVFCQNQVESIILTIAAYRLGLIHVPIDPGVLSNITDVQHMVDTVIEHYHPDHVAILANDATTAERLDQVMLGFPTLKICIEPGYAGWTSFENLLDEADAVQNEEEEPTRAFDERSVFFTSGSTSLPKCCLNKPALWFHVLGSSLTLGSASPQDSVLVTVPTSHAFGYICMMMSLLRGACVVFASARFNSQLVVNTMKQERCTHAAIVPTMVHSLVGELASSGTKVESLKGVTLAGAAIGLELLETCKECLGVTTVENFYGMTEGVFATTGPVEELGQVVNGRDVAVGKPVQGAKLRICAPDDSSIVPRGVPGELHYSGHSVIRGYVGDRTDDFYEANGEPWFITGDRALVDHEGRLFILGRRKDMIVRGGKNISLPKIERVLSQVPEMCALEPQIVAAADPIAGEVPLAVIKRRTDYSLAKQLQDTILSSLGVAHVPVQVVALETLGLADYPRTPAGKIKKPKLAETVRAYLESQAADDIQPLASVTNLTLKVQSVWARVLGYRLVDLDIKRPISEFADSIIMLIARDKIRKETGRSIPLTQWNISKTISEQIHLLENGTTENRPNSTRSEPPHVEQIVHLGGNEGKLHATKATVNKTISQYGLCWDDVADVCPCTDFIQLVSRARAIDDWNIRTSIVTRDASTEHLREALRATLLNNPLMLSFIVIDPTDLGPELGLHVMIRPTKEYLDHCIQDYGTVDNLDDVQFLTKNYPFQDHAKLPGPLFRALIVFVRKTNSAAVITNCSHAILDGVYHGHFNEDLDYALGDQPLRPHVPFKSWADSYHTLRKSPMAETAVNFHQEYLYDLGKHCHALWPHPTHELIIAPERKNMDLNFITFAAPSFVRLRERYPNLTTPIILKAALALLVISHTNHSHAVFLNLEAARSMFPFLPTSVASQGTYDATDVAGPTFSGVINLVAFHPEETVLDYLIRVQETQALLSKHASVPWHEVFRRLDPSADILPSIAQSLVFNWTPGMGPAILGENPFQNMKVMLTHIRTKIGMLACAGAGGPDGSQVFIYMEGALANTSAVWVKRAGEEMKRIALWLSEEGSLSLPVAQFTRALGYD